MLIKKIKLGKATQKFGNLKMGNDPYSYDIPDDKDLFSKKPTKKDDGDDKKMKFAGFSNFF